MTIEFILLFVEMRAPRTRAKNSGKEIWRVNHICTRQSDFAWNSYSPVWRVRFDSYSPTKIFTRHGELASAYVAPCVRIMIYEINLKYSIVGRKNICILTFYSANIIRHVK